MDVTLDFSVVADVCAGDGSVAKLLVDYGWDARKIICIDRYRSPSPLVGGVTWEYWNVDQLGLALLAEKEIPSCIERYREFFDLVVMMQALGGVGSDSAEAVSYFLCRVGGLAYYSGSFSYFELVDG